MAAPIGRKVVNTLRDDRDSLMASQTIGLDLRIQRRRNRDTAGLQLEPPNHVDALVPLTHSIAERDVKSMDAICQACRTSSVQKQRLAAFRQPR